ncbi:hypothetical protein N9009_00305 [bacterium]|nr:hypothetical protein [bacterium]
MDKGIGVNPLIQGKGFEKLNDLGGLVYQKLRAPSLSGETLQVPLLSKLDDLWQANLRRIASGHSTRFDRPLKEIQALGRAELIHRSLAYSGVYLDDLPSVTSQNIIMSGHQPELFHPGVWYKNFVLSELGNRQSALAVNLVVDNDLCSHPSVSFPRVPGQASNWQETQLERVAMDAFAEEVPYESRPVIDWKLFESFGARLSERFCRGESACLINHLWRHVIVAASRLNNQPVVGLGQLVAAGRHRLESEYGLRTLEVPISHLAETSAFTCFFKSILSAADEFRLIHNSVLDEYRNAHQIRSESHPVPKLAEHDGWIEVPFWIWSDAECRRQRLYVRYREDQVLLSNLSGWEFTCSLADVDGQVSELKKTGVLIRPRALTTTLFSRLILSDLFLHGIGGAKYDELTNLIAQRFFEVRLPDFQTLTATMKLSNSFDLVSRPELTELDRELREIRFHPERFIQEPSESVANLIAQKQAWAFGESAFPRTRERHVAIEKLNRQLAASAKPRVDSLKERRADRTGKKRASEILSSREFSFCLFDSSIMDELKQLASI